MPITHMKADGREMGIFDLVEGLSEVDADAAAEFAGTMVNEVIPEIVKDMDHRRRARRRREVTD